MNFNCIVLKENIKIKLNDQDFGNINTICFEIPIKNKQNNMLIECSLYNSLCNVSRSGDHVKFENSDVEYILISTHKIKNFNKVQFEVSYDDYQNKFIKLCSDLFKIIDHKKTKLSTDSSS